MLFVQAWRDGKTRDEPANRKASQLDGANPQPLGYGGEYDAKA
jgi:hypothetical protein